MCPAPSRACMCAPCVLMAGMTGGSRSRRTTCDIASGLASHLVHRAYACGQVHVRDLRGRRRDQRHGDLQLHEPRPPLFQIVHDGPRAYADHFGMEAPRVHVYRRRMHTNCSQAPSCAAMPTVDWIRLLRAPLRTQADRRQLVPDVGRGEAREVQRQGLPWAPCDIYASGPSCRRAQPTSAECHGLGRSWMCVQAGVSFACGVRVCGTIFLRSASDRSTTSSS